MNRRTTSNRRKNCGCLMPNIYTALQFIALAISVEIIVAIAKAVGISGNAGIVFGILVVMVIAIILLMRRKVLNRQFTHCKGHRIKHEARGGKL